MSASELKRLVATRVELMARLELANAQHDEAVDAISKEMASANDAIATLVSAPDVKLPSKKRAKPNTRRPDHDGIAKKYADFDPSATGCLCGCGEHVADDLNFVRGHQNNLRSIAGAVAAGKLIRDKVSDAGWSHAVTAGWVKDD